MSYVNGRTLGGVDLGRLRDDPFTYAEVGASQGDLPSGYHHLRRSIIVGTGPARFQHAARTVMTWEMHRRSGLSVQASSQSAVEGAVAVLRLGWPGLGVSAPVRVIHVVDQSRRKGFAYGSLPGHPESGEELFVVELGDDGQVTFTITAFSRPASMLARAGGPISRLAQTRITNRYLRSVQT